MSSTYNSQPATKGKVILSTSGGDLEIELWPKECPKACRNFVQLCLEGYYDNTAIHRIIPKFIVQCGDPTGSGSGGESIYGAPFKDEFHSRLRFTQRGLLAMASTGVNQNSSQFFFTLEATPALNGKHTIFGKVVGNTVFNLLKLGELQTDKDDRPVFDAQIISCKILSNPFDDIVPRTTPEEKLAQKAQREREEKARQDVLKPKGTKNFSLLSFGGDAAREESLIQKTTLKSSHDVLEETEGFKKQVAPADQASTAAAPTKQSAFTAVKRKALESDDDDDDEKYDKTMKEKVTKQKKNSSKDGATATNNESLQDQIKRLQGEIKQIGAPKKKDQVVAKPEKGVVARMRREFLNSGRASPALGKDTKKDVEKKLLVFEDALEKAAKISAASAHAKSRDGVAEEKRENEVAEEVWECSLHFIKNCSSCRDSFGKEESDDDEGWMNASLKFEKEVGANVFKPKVDDYAVIDPRQGAKADPFGRDIQILGDIKSKQKALGIWQDRSTRTVKAKDDQQAEAPDFARYQ